MISMETVDTAAFVWLGFAHPPIDSIIRLMTVWRITGKISELPLC